MSRKKDYEELLIKVIYDEFEIPVPISPPEPMEVSPTPPVPEIPAPRKLLMPQIPPTPKDWKVSGIKKVKQLSRPQKRGGGVSLWCNG